MAAIFALVALLLTATRSRCVTAASVTPATTPAAPHLQRPVDEAAGARECSAVNCS